MIRKLFYAVILGALFFAPLNRVEIANLEPIQAVWMYYADGALVLETDTEDKGSGATVAEALENMKGSSPGIIYLDTAQYLFVSEDAQAQIPALQPYIKGSSRLCVWNGQGSIADAVKYTDAHKLGEKMKSWKQGSKLPEIPLLNTAEIG